MAAMRARGVNSRMGVVVIFSLVSVSLLFVYPRTCSYNEQSFAVRTIVAPPSQGIHEYRHQPRRAGAQARRQLRAIVRPRPGRAAQLRRRRAGARRILLTLVHLGYMEAAGRQFRLTPKVLDLGYAYLSSLPVWSQAQPILEELTAELRQSCSATVLDGGDIVYVLRLATHRTMSINLSVGSRLPAYCTAMGRVLLSGLAPEQLQRQLATAALLKVTPQTETDPARLATLIAVVRQQGWCLVQDELELGLSSIAVPITDRAGGIVAAINISGPTAAATATLREQYLPRLQAAAARISSLMRTQRRPRRAPGIWRGRAPSSNALDDDGDALPHADAHGAQRVAPAAALQLVHRGRHQARAAHAQRMAERDGAAVRIDARVVVAQAERAQHRQSLRGKGLVQFDDVDLVQRHAELAQQLLRGRHRPHAHDARRHAGARHADHAGARCQAVAPGRVGAGQQQGAGAVVDARRVAGRDAAIRPDHAFQFRQRLDGGRARMLVLREDDGIAFFLCQRHRHDFIVEAAFADRLRRLILAGQRKAVLVGAADAEIVGHVLGRLRHRVDAVQFFHQRIGKAPADGGVVDRRGAGKSRVRLAHHERRARHRLDAAGEHQARLAGADGARGRADRVHARTAQAVDGSARHFLRQAGQQRRHARHVAVVFAGLVGAAVDDVVDGAPVDAGITAHQLAQRQRAEVVGADVFQRAGVAADRGADRVADKGISHFGLLFITVTAARRSPPAILPSSSRQPFALSSDRPA